MRTTKAPRRAEAFIVTKEHRRFMEFANVVRKERIARITGGNFRLLRRLFLQIERVLRVNELTVITDDVVNAARRTLVIGVS